MQKSTHLQRRIVVRVEGQGGVTLSFVCVPHCHRFPIEDWWFSTRHGKTQCNWWCAACGGQYNWRNPNRVLVMHDSADPSKATVFRAHAPPQGACENVASALKLLANQQLGGDGGAKQIVYYG